LIRIDVSAIHEGRDTGMLYEGGHMGSRQ